MQENKMLAEFSQMQIKLLLKCLLLQKVPLFLEKVMVLAENL